MKIKISFIMSFKKYINMSHHQKTSQWQNSLNRDKSESTNHKHSYWNTKSVNRGERA